MTFIAWLQERLIAHGASIKADGDWGRNSIAALQAFQRLKGLIDSGVADQVTIAALREAPAGGTTRPMPMVAAATVMPPWMAEMHRKMGLHEVSNTASLIEWLKIGKYLGNPKNLPWCGDAVESCIAKTLPQEPLPSNPFFAQAWKDFGIDADGPAVGAIGVIRWDPSSGHVGIVAGISGDRVNLLGGNQSNSINISSFPRSKLIAFRWPSTFPKQEYRPLKGTAAAADFGATR
jgi:uncharacterized protein (TIGR02594 family)